MGTIFGINGEIRKRTLKNIFLRITSEYYYKIKIVGFFNQSIHFVTFTAVMTVWVLKYLSIKSPLSPISMNTIYKNYPSLPFYCVCIKLKRKSCLSLSEFTQIAQIIIVPPRKQHQPWLAELCIVH